VWCYTGFTYEQLSKSDRHKKLLEHVDVLVDGPFILEQKSYDLNFKGSKNQRCLHLDKGNVIRVD
jgi:anaerobic ribonucleoside-triphosphate reductase activating protein